MENIIAGRFETEDEAKSAAASLAPLANKNDIFVFFNNQPGAHDADGRPADQDAAESAAKGGAAGAAAGSAAAGIVGTVVGGPAIGAVATAVGGYTGSLMGTARGLSGVNEHASNASHSRSAGMMLAVRVADAKNRQRIIDRLRQHGAADIETAKGEWRNGEWLDFDPMSSPQLAG